MRPVVKYTKVVTTSFGRERENRLKFDGDGGAVEKALAGQMALQGPSKCTAGRPLISRHWMPLEEIPDDDARVKVAAKVAHAPERLITAWPVVAATFDRV